MRRLLLCVALVGLVAAPSLQASDKAKTLGEAELAKDNLGGISLGIIHGHELVYEAAFGYADMDLAFGERLPLPFRISRRYRLEALRSG